MLEPLTNPYSAADHSELAGHGAWQWCMQGAALNYGRTMNVLAWCAGEAWWCELSLLLNVPHTAPARHCSMRGKAAVSSCCCSASPVIPCLDGNGYYGVNVAAKIATIAAAAAHRLPWRCQMNFKGCSPCLLFAATAMCATPDSTTRVCRLGLRPSLRPSPPAAGMAGLCC